MENDTMLECTAFIGENCICSGHIDQVIRHIVTTINHDALPSVMVFNDANGELIEVDYRGQADDVLGRLSDYIAKNSHASEGDIQATAKKRGRGRPKLGVIAREVTLLPRHWDWLSRQPGGASVTLRKLVEQARRAHRETDAVRLARESAYRFINIMAGDRAGFEEAGRALFSGNRKQFANHMVTWPEDIQEYASKLAAASFEMHA